VAETVTEEIFRVGQENGWLVSKRPAVMIEAAVSATRGRRNITVTLTEAGAVKQVFTDGRGPRIGNRDKRAQAIAYLRAPL
jgi:hypothetical protein